MTLKEKVKIAFDRAVDCLDDTEFNLRNERTLASANRAYYTFYYAICALLYSEEISAKTHQGNHAKFNELFIKTGIFKKEVGTWVEKSFRLRQDADYDLEAEITEEDAKEIVDKAHKFIDLVKKYFADTHFPFP
jgi:uncharacterized protein (UPF0332 family)